MGNLCCTETPDINLSCGNNNVNSSCCKWNSLVEEEETQNAHGYKWIYSIKYNDQTVVYDSRTCHSNLQTCYTDAVNTILPKTSDDGVFDLELYIVECDITTKKQGSLVYMRNWAMPKSKSDIKQVWKHTSLFAR